MRKSRFTDEQKIAIVQQAVAAAQVCELCRKHGITEQTFYRWRGKLDGLQVADAKRLRALEDENRRLKQLVADLSLDSAMLKDVAGRNWRRRRKKHVAITRVRCRNQVRAPSAGAWTSSVTRCSTATLPLLHLGR